MKILYTDGSALPNPGKGGFAVIEKVGESWCPVVLGTEEKSTNIRMEGKAMIAAIKYAGEEGCEIRSDSEFWINVLTKWAPTWQKNDWSKKPKKDQDEENEKNSQAKNLPPKPDKNEIKNLDIVKELYELYCAHPVKLTWVKGHAGKLQNELADEWANKARQGAKI